MRQDGPRFNPVSRSARDEQAHCGYQEWHRKVDEEVIDIFRPRGMQGDIVVSERFKSSTEQFVWDPSHLGPAPLPTT
jgi:hypothetical protein